MKLAGRIASVPQDFELRQQEIDKVEKLKIVEEEEHEFQPEEDCVEVTTLLTIEGTITFSQGQTVSEEKVWLHWNCFLPKVDDRKKMGLYRDSRLGLSLGRNCETISQQRKY